MGLASFNRMRRLQAEKENEEKPLKKGGKKNAKKNKDAVRDK